MILVEQTESRARRLSRHRGKRVFTESNEVTGRFLVIVHLVQVLLFGNLRAPRLHRDRARHTHYFRNVEPRRARVSGRVRRVWAAKNPTPGESSRPNESCANNVEEEKKEEARRRPCRCAVQIFEDSRSFAVRFVPFTREEATFLGDFIFRYDYEQKRVNYEKKKHAKTIKKTNDSWENTGNSRER